MMSFPSEGGEQSSGSTDPELTTAQGLTGLGHRPGSPIVSNGCTVLRDYDAQCQNSQRGRRGADLTGSHTQNSTPKCPLDIIIVSNEVSSEEEKKHDPIAVGDNGWDTVVRKRKRVSSHTGRCEKRDRKQVKSVVIFGTREIETLKAFLRVCGALGLNVSESDIERFEYAGFRSGNAQSGTNGWTKKLPIHVNSQTFSMIPSSAVVVILFENLSCSDRPHELCRCVPLHRKTEFLIRELPMHPVLRLARSCAPFVMKGKESRRFQL